MDWENERYVRLYTRSTVAWRMLPWESKALWPLLLREVDRAGLLALDGHGARGLAALVDLPIEVVEPGLQGLLDDGCVRLLGDGARLFVPNFIEAQEAKQSDKQRQSESRERRRAIAQAEADGLISVTNRDDESQNVTICHENGQNVTARHTPSQSVTPSLAVPSLAVQIETSESAVADVSACRSAFTPEDLAGIWNTSKPPECPAVQKLSDKRRKRAAQRIREEPEPEYWLAAIQAMHSIPFLRGNGRRGWRADFDWLLQPDSATRILEGSWDGGPAEASNDPEPEYARRLL